jgi:hypothetical protein
MRQFVAVLVAAVRACFRSTMWYVSGLGPIKLVSIIRDRERTQVHKSFTHGK